MIELLVENKGDGKLYEISELVTDISFSDSLNNGCSKLEFSYIYDNMVITNGSIVRFKYGGTNIFFGYVFSHDHNQGSEISVVAYDQLRYLKAKDILVIKDMRADELIVRIANMYKLNVGVLEDTGYKLPVAVKENQTYLDMIYESISSTLIATGRKYAFYDDFGSLRLSELRSMQLPLVIGDGSLAYSYSYSQSIDQNTYNLIRIAQENEKTGKLDIYQAQDSSSFKKYGILSYFEKADKNTNPEQLKAKVDGLLKLMNAETRSLSIDALGDIRIRAGNSILANIADQQINQYVIVNSVKHTYKANVHTMNLELIL